MKLPVARAVATAGLILVACAAIALLSSPSPSSDSTATQLALAVEQWAAVPLQRQPQNVKYYDAQQQARAVFFPQRVAQQQLELFPQSPPAGDPAAPAPAAPAGVQITDAPTVPVRNLPPPSNGPRPATRLVQDRKR